MPKQAIKASLTVNTAWSPTSTASFFNVSSKMRQITCQSTYFSSWPIKGGQISSSDSSACIADACIQSDTSHTDLHSKQIPSTEKCSLLQKQHELLPPHACPPRTPFRFIRWTVFSQLKETSVLQRKWSPNSLGDAREHIPPSARSFLNHGVAATHYSQYWFCQ